MGGGSVRAPGPGQATLADVIRCGPGLVLTYWDNPAHLSLQDGVRPRGQARALLQPTVRCGPGRPRALPTLTASCLPHTCHPQPVKGSSLIRPRAGLLSSSRTRGWQATCTVAAAATARVHGCSLGISGRQRRALWAPPWPGSDGADTIITDPRRHRRKQRPGKRQKVATQTLQALTLRETLGVPQEADENSPPASPFECWGLPLALPSAEVLSPFLDAWLA